MAPISQRDEFANELDGYISAVKIDHDNKAYTVTIAPGETVMLSEVEQELTSQAPNNASDNPFVERELIFYDHMTGEESKRVTSPILRRIEGKRPTGVAQADSTPSGTG